jgi:fucose permease
VTDERAGPASGADVATEERARVALAVVFFACGIALASWISRIPGARDSLGLGPAELGLLLLCLSAGSVAGLPSSGPVVQRLGPAAAVRTGGVLVGLGMLTVAGGVSADLVVLAGVGLVVTGFGMATWDVAQNVEAADVEQRLGRTLMPRFHAGFSIGTVAGALAGAGCARLGVGVPAQLIATAVLVSAAVVVAARWFLPVPVIADGGVRTSAQTLRAWRERRTLLIGLLVLSFAFTEGVANDWLTVAFVDGHGTSDAVGALGFGVFVTAMTVSRLVGGGALERWGRPAVLRVTAGLAAAGLLLVVFGPSLPWAVAGALLWGAGAALGFPVGMSAAGDDPARAAGRVSVVASIGYTAFLAGPPLVGFLAEQAGILRSLLVVFGALALALLTAGATASAGPSAGPSTASEQQRQQADGDADQQPDDCRQ